MQLVFAGGSSDGLRVPVERPGAGQSEGAQVVDGHPKAPPDHRFQGFQHDLHVEALLGEETGVDVPRGLVVRNQTDPLAAGDQLPRRPEQERGLSGSEKSPHEDQANLLHGLHPALWTAPVVLLSADSNLFLLSFSRNPARGSSRLIVRSGLAGDTPVGIRLSIPKLHGERKGKERVEPLHAWKTWVPAGGGV
jgi:hypothetical protein